MPHPIGATREPDFGQMLKVLRRERPDRPVLCEFAINGHILSAFADPDLDPAERENSASPYWPSAWRNLGFDYVMAAGTYRFPIVERPRQRTVSLNEGSLITDRASFESFGWTEPDESHFALYREACLPDGMKLITTIPGGVLENVVNLVGYERLCLWTMDEPDLLGEVFDAVGSRLVRIYEICAGYENVGACFVNDDWGFKTQTMLPPSGMRRYVIPWHKRLVDVIHAAGKPALLHSCGNLDEVMEDVIEEIGFDAKHSFEDSILPIEDAYERWGSRIALLGGIDVDFLCRSTPDAIRARSRAMLERAADRGGYALGSGNSVPDYVPDESFLAMMGVVLETSR